LQKIESELLRTQVECCVEQVRKMEKNMVSVSKQAAKAKIMEERAIVAEDHARRLAEVLNRLKYSIPQLKKVIADSREKSAHSCDIIASQSAKMTEIDQQNSALFEEKQSLRDEMSKMQAELDDKSDQIASLKAKLQAFPSTPAPRAAEDAGRKKAAAGGTPSGAEDEEPAAGLEPLSSPSNVVKDLKDKIKSLQARLAHAQSRAEISELSKHALTVNIQQLKAGVEHAQAAEQQLSRELSEVKAELQDYKTNGVVGREQLVRENRALKAELAAQRAANEALHAELRDIRSTVHQAMRASNPGMSSAGSGAFDAASAGMLRGLGRARAPLDLDAAEAGGGGDSSQGDEEDADVVLDLSTGRVFSETTGTLHPISGPHNPVINASLGASAGPQQVVISFPGSSASSSSAGKAPLKADGSGSASRRPSSSGAAAAWSAPPPSAAKGAGASEAAAATEQGGGGGGGGRGGDMVVHVDLSSSAPVSLGHEDSAGPAAVFRSVSFLSSSDSLLEDEQAEGGPASPDLAVYRDENGATLTSVSPVVEDRLLRNVFAKYTAESKGLMRASR
jgi:predicted  nucleic acid-binding Zn-ribbon protein